MKRFHQVISIIFGVIISFILYLIALSLFVDYWVNVGIILFSYMLGGFIAVFYAREKKIQYALYEGILIMLIIVLLGNVASSDVNIAFLYGILIILLAVIGGMIGLMMDKNFRQSFKTKYLDKGFSLIAIITGIIITFIIWLFVSLITYSIIHPTNPSIFNSIEKAGLIGISVIGGFIATFMVKEKQLLNGICVGLGIILSVIVLTVYAVIKGYPNPYLSRPLITLTANLGYILAPTVGSYLAIVVAKHQKQIV
jgi:putative membrane protein (TIGR04086 family)